MATETDRVEPGDRDRRAPLEIGPAPDGDRTSLWIRSAIVAVLVLILLRLVGRIR
ncbi:MAG: hypothetical protein AAFZ07_15110 [Actinomycetota bacterium]